MPYVDWSTKSRVLITCNCDWGCPCQFNAPPSHGNCRAAVAGRIDEGHFGDVRLDGLAWVSLLAWPGAIHEGNGEALLIVDERADARQREALLKILSGEETEPGATVFNVFAQTLTKVHDPLFKPIEFEADVTGRTGGFRVSGVVEAKGEPLRNPITGEPHRARLVLPAGFEYHEAEVASSTTAAGGPIPLEWAGSHAHFATVHMAPHGVVA